MEGIKIKEEEEASLYICIEYSPQIIECTVWIILVREYLRALAALMRVQNRDWFDGKLLV